MLPIPPLGYANFAGTQSLRQSEDKSEQVQRAQDQQKDSAQAADRYEHSVESADAVQPIHDEDHRQQQKKNKYAKKPAAKDQTDGDDTTHLDLTA